MAHTKQIPVCKYGDRYMLLRAYGYIYFKVDELKINHPCITHFLIYSYYCNRNRGHGLFVTLSCTV